MKKIQNIVGCQNSLTISLWNYISYYGDAFDVYKAIKDITSYSTGIEFWPSTKEFIDRTNWLKMRKLLDGMKDISVHGLFTTENPETSYMQIDMCERLGATILIVHHNMLGFYDGDELSPNWNSSLDFTNSLIEYGEKKGVELAVENILSFSVIKRMIRSLPQIKVCVDTGHANLDKDHSVTDYLRHFQKRLAHIHVHDNRGHGGLSIKPGRPDMDDYDQHLPPGDGIINWTEFSSVLSEINYQGTLSLEIRNLNPNWSK